MSRELAESRNAKSPILLWHLLSLDAPTVATLWAWFIARMNHIDLSHSALMAMATAVWTLYAADRLLDTQMSPADLLEIRHHFHYRHRTAFLTGIALSSVMLAALLPQIPSEAIHLYLVLGGFVFGYFIVIHVARSAHRLPKEIAVGVCFAAAVFIPTVAREPHLRSSLLIPALLFAALCSLNCLFIYAWEHPTEAEQTPHPLTAAALRHLRTLSVALIVVSAALALVDRRAPWPIYGAEALAAALLLMMHVWRRSCDALTLRTAADLALLTPALLIGFL